MCYTSRRVKIVTTVISYFISTTNNYFWLRKKKRQSATFMLFLHHFIFPTKQVIICILLATKSHQLALHWHRWEVQTCQQPAERREVKHSMSRAAVPITEHTPSPNSNHFSHQQANFSASMKKMTDIPLTYYNDTRAYCFVPFFTDYEESP